MEAFLNDLLPRVLPHDVDWKIIDHGSKWQLLRSVPTRLVGYARMPVLVRPKSLILVDRDDDDCAALKLQLECACGNAKLTTKTVPGEPGCFDVVNRIVVEELEAWFFGDVEAVGKAWSGVPVNLANRVPYRDPDQIRGGTHEALLRVLQNAGHYRGIDRLPKIDVARRMGALIDPGRNRSQSFHTFLTGLRALVAAA